MNDLDLITAQLAEIKKLQRAAKLWARFQERGEGGLSELQAFIFGNRKIRAVTDPDALKVRDAIIAHLRRLSRLRFVAKVGCTRRRHEWELRDDIPTLYRETDPARLPDVAAFNAALAAEREADGLTLWGETGCGKSRALYACARVAFIGGEDVKIISPGAIKRAALRPADWAELLREITEADVVLLDDLSHSRFSESYAAALLELVETATSNRHPRLFVTLQCAGRDLIKKWVGNDADLRPTAEAIARRIGPDFAATIEFKK